MTEPPQRDGTQAKSKHVQPPQAGFGVGSNLAEGIQDTFAQMLEEPATARGDWPPACLRHVDPLGDNASGEIGEDPAGVPANLILFVALVATGLRLAVPVRHDDFDKPDGMGVRDHIHVELGPAYGAALDWVADNRGRRALNLSTGTGIELWLGEMIRIFQEVLGQPVPSAVAPQRWGDVAASRSDPTRALRELGRRTIRAVHEWCEGAVVVQRRRLDHAGAPGRTSKAA